MTHHVPHTPEWFKLLEAKNPQQAAHTRRIIALAGKVTVCSVCGDEEVRDYLVGAEKFGDGSDVTARLCDDCVRMQTSGFGAKFVPLDEALPRR